MDETKIRAAYIEKAKLIIDGVKQQRDGLRQTPVDIIIRMLLVLTESAWELEQKAAASSLPSDRLFATILDRLSERAFFLGLVALSPLVLDGVDTEKIADTLVAEHREVRRILSEKQKEELTTQDAFWAEFRASINNEGD